MPTDGTQTQETTTTTQAAQDAAAAAAGAPAAPAPPAKYSQADLDRILGRKIDEERKAWSAKVQAEQTARAELATRIEELEKTSGGATETVEQLKTARKTDAKKWADREAELLKSQQETQSRWDHEKVVNAITAAVPSKVQDALRPLLIEHLVGRSKVVNGKVVYTDPDTLEDLAPEVAVEKQLAAKPALVTGPASGTGGRPGTPPSVATAGKPRAQRSAEEQWAAAEAEEKAARSKK